MRPVLEATEAAFRYWGRDRAVGPFSLTVGEGELHHVNGPSGCGKSTFARMLAGLIPHLYRGEFHGAVRVGDSFTRNAPLWQLSARVGLVGQNPTAQLLAATVEDEILFGLENLGLSRTATQTRLDHALGAFGLHTLAHRDPRTLSGGEQQKLVLAAIAARQPRVIVLDEAVSMLDAASALGVAEHIERLRREGTAVITFEHRASAQTWHRDGRCHTLASESLTALPLPELPRQIAPFAVSVRGLRVDLGGHRVLEDIDLPLAGGRVIALVGANGAGKTTLLRALAGLQTYSGSLHADDRRDPGLGLCFQDPDQQIFNPTVRQEIRFGNTAVDEPLYRCTLELFDLAAYEDTPPLLLSEGEKKRLALAILLTRPGLRGLCLDEPTLGQDDRHRRSIGQIVRRLAAAGYLCIVATHDIEWVAEWCDEFVVLHDGRIIQRERVTTRQCSAGEEQGCAASP